MDINLIAPICNTGYGVVGLNLLLALERLGHVVCLYPRGRVEADQKYGNIIQRAIDRRIRPNLDAPTVTLSQHAEPELLLTMGRGVRMRVVP